MFICIYTLNVSDLFSMFHYHRDAKNIGYTLVKLVRHKLTQTYDFCSELKRGVLSVATLYYFIEYMNMFVCECSQSTISFSYHLNYG